MKSIQRKLQTLFSNWGYHHQHRQSFLSPLKFLSNFSFDCSSTDEMANLKNVGHSWQWKLTTEKITLGALDPLLMIVRLKWEPCPLHCIFTVHQIPENFSPYIFHSLYSSPKELITSKGFSIVLTSILCFINYRTQVFLTWFLLSPYKAVFLKNDRIDRSLI